MAPISSAAPSDFAWRVLGLLNIYRLLVPIVLVTMQWLIGPEWALAAVRPPLFLSTCIAYFTTAVMLIIARRLDWASLRIVTLVNASVDTIAIAQNKKTSGGIA